MLWFSFIHFWKGQTTGEKHIEPLASKTILTDYCTHHKIAKKCNKFLKKKLPFKSYMMHNTGILMKWCFTLDKNLASLVLGLMMCVKIVLQKASSPLPNLSAILFQCCIIDIPSIVSKNYLYTMLLSCELWRLNQPSVTNDQLSRDPPLVCLSSTRGCIVLRVWGMLSPQLAPCMALMPVYIRYGALCCVSSSQCSWQPLSILSNHSSALQLWTADSVCVLECQGIVEEQKDRLRWWVCPG